MALEVLATCDHKDQEAPGPLWSLNSNRPEIPELRLIPSDWHLSREHKSREPQRASRSHALQLESPLTKDK